MSKIYKQIQGKLDQLVQEKISSIVMKELVKEVYGRSDYFCIRSFDVMYCRYKKDYPGIRFHRKSGVITIWK